jgi:type IV pilus assembly protein PilC
MQFSYKAKDAENKRVEGTLEAADRFAAARELRTRGDTPISITELSAKAKGEDFMAKLNGFFSHVSLREKILFTHNLAGMVSAGLTLYRALEVEKKQNKNPAMAVVFDSLLATINQGGTLSDGLAKHPKVFSTLFVSMVKAGEESGNLSGTLKDIGTSLEKSYDLSRKVKGALMYPSVIVSAIIIIGVLMLVFVVPTLTKIFKDLGSELPATTKFVIALSDGAAAHPILLVALLALFFGGITFFFRSPRFAKASDKIILLLPVIGTISKKVNTARAARTLSSLLAAGVEMTRAIAITTDVLQNSYYKKVMARAGEAVQKGATLSSVFKEETKLFPVMMGEMMAVGEETGALTQMLGDVANFYEEEVDAQTKNLSTIIEPMLMVLIGGAVGFFAISMISPMYSLLNNL